MSPKRIALLFGCPGQHPAYLNGVNYDLLNMSNFLRTDEGGCWSNTEIFSFYSASERDVHIAMKQAKADYIFCYFSGHGFNQNGVQYLCCKDSEIPESALIARNTKKQIIIQDTCRTIVEAPELHGYIPYGDIIEDLKDKPTRLLLDRGIEESEEGVLMVYSTQLGFAARDTAFGGWFTDSLLHQCRNIISPSNNYEPRQIDSILPLIGELDLRDGQIQAPEFSRYTGNLSIPFAFGIPDHVMTEYKSVSPSP